jgi:hypothetical protein
MATAIITSFQQVCDSNGDPLSGAKVYVYDEGTTNLQTLYSDEGLGGGDEAANPIVCDSAGRHDMRYKASGSYKIVVKTTADVTVYTRDHIDGGIPIGSGALAIANGGTSATSAGAALTALGAASTTEMDDLAAEVASLAGTLGSIDKTHIATGTSAQRPASPADGDIRFNSSTGYYEGYKDALWQSFPQFYPGATTGPTAQVFTSGTAQTYTTPTGCKFLKIRMIGGGGGGGGTGTNDGGTGGTTSFNSITCVGGTGGQGKTNIGGGAGGTGGTGSAMFRIPGGVGVRGFINGTGASINCSGGQGGNGPFGGGGGEGANGATNSGAGGGGFGGSGIGSAASGGGGAGEYAEFTIAFPGASYTYSVGTSGTAGTGGGGAGAAGIIIVEEHYII